MPSSSFWRVRARFRSERQTSPIPEYPNASPRSSRPISRDAIVRASKRSSAKQTWALARRINTKETRVEVDSMAQLIVALDVPSAERAEELVDELYDLDLIVKVGLEALFGYAQRILAYCEARDVRTFIDAKLHDIPRTVAAACGQLVRPNVHIINVHALGGLEMMRAAVDAANERAAELGVEPPHVMAVTLLTSIAPEDLN